MLGECATYTQKPFLIIRFKIDTTNQVRDDDEFNSAGEVRGSLKKRVKVVPPRPIEAFTDPMSVAGLSKALQADD